MTPILWLNTEQQPLLSGLTAASVQGTQALGRHAGQRLRRLLTDPAAWPP